MQQEEDKRLQPCSCRSNMDELHYDICTSHFRAFFCYSHEPDSLSIHWMPRRVPCSMHECGDRVRSIRAGAQGLGSILPHRLVKMPALPRH